MFPSCTCSVPCLDCESTAPTFGPEDISLRSVDGHLGQGSAVGMWVGCFSLQVCVFCRHHGGSPWSCFLSVWNSVGTVAEFLAEGSGMMGKI